MNVSNSTAFQLACPDLSNWRSGNTGVEGVWQFDSGITGRHVMITALIHGNELCGAWAVKGLLEAGVRPQQGKLTLAFCNLAAFDTFDANSHDASRFVDEDMNRQWSGERLQALNSQERRRVAALQPFVDQADWLLDLHSMHERAEPLLLTGMHPRNRAFAKSLGAPEYIVIDAGHKDGVRMRDFGRFALPDYEAPHTRSLLLECGFHGDESSRSVAQDMCLRFLVEAGTVSASDAMQRLPSWFQDDAPHQWALEVTGAVVARSERFRFIQPFHGLEQFSKAGTVIGHHDGAELGEAVVTPYDDCVLVMPSTKQARAGVTVARFAKQSPL
jgi:hypothetical protein